MIVQHLHSAYSARDRKPELAGAHSPIRGAKGMGRQAGFSAADARASPLAGRKGRRWNLLKASFNLFLFDFSFISVTQTPEDAILFQLI
jgi:hypothetical protein